MIYFARWKVIVVLGVCALGFIFAAPNLVGSRTAESLPGWFKQVSLGLDLQGGSHLLLEVDVEAVLAERLESLVDSVRVALRESRIRYTGLGVRGHAVSVVILDADRADEARDRLRSLDTATTTEAGDGGRITLALTEQAIRDRRSSVVAQSIEIVRRRIDETGVREPTIQRQGEDRILLQLPGVGDPEWVKRLLGQTAKMTFHLLDNRVQAAQAMAGRVPAGGDATAVHR